MINKEILDNEVTLYNYIGEVDDYPAFQRSYIKKCCVFITRGADLDGTGRKGNGNAVLFIFDNESTVTNELGEPASYLPYDAWLDREQEEADRGCFWTLSDRGDDYFVEGVSLSDTPPQNASKFRVVKFKQLKKGSGDIGHMEVFGV